MNPGTTDPQATRPHRLRRTPFAAKGPLEISVGVAAPGMTNDVTAAETALAKLVISRL